MNDMLVAHKQYIHEEGIDLPEVRDWVWHTPEDK
jgi:xylulose-5-phosphate/fructose-6-phosphate phosphoketolase